MKAIEEVFVPVVVFNNRPGKDAEILKRYGEPSWNFQVVRYLDGAGKDIVPRKDRVWTAAATAVQMVSVLEKLGKVVPAGLKALSDEGKEAAVTVEREAVFAMACYWEGEARLGRIDGVLATEVGWLEGKEAVKVKYDAKRVWLRRLVKAAEEMKCASAIWVNDEKEVALAEEIATHSVAAGFEGFSRAADGEQKYYLQRSGYAGLEMSEAQRVKVNAALRFKADPQVFLTREQLAKVSKR